MKTILFLLFVITLFTTAHAQSVGVVTSNTAYAFYQNRWYPEAISGENPKISASNDTICVVTSRFVYIFGNRQWKQIRGLNVEDPRDINVTISQGVIGITTTTRGYAFNKGQWREQSLLATERPKAITSKNGNLLLITNSSCYAFNSNTNSWLPRQQLNGPPVDYTH